MSVKYPDNLELIRTEFDLVEKEKNLENSPPFHQQSSNDSNFSK